MSALKRSNDRKVAADVTAAGNVRIANAFGLPSGKSFSCPGATSVCEKVCYAGKIEKVRKAVMSVMTHNWDLLRDESEAGMVSLLSEMITDFDAECERKGGNRAFRIHWDGDFFSRTYAAAWATVIKMYPNVQFWAYTRSFDYVPELVGLSNLSLYLSVDSDNIGQAVQTRKNHPEVRWAYLSNTFEEGKKDMMDIWGKPGAACPELTGAIPLISDKGGACIACNLCPGSKADVRFAVKKR